MGAIGATPGGGAKPALIPEVDRAQAGHPGTALIHTGLGGAMRLIVRLTRDYYETIAGMRLLLMRLL